MARIPTYQARAVALTGGIPRVTTDLGGIAEGLQGVSQAIAGYADRRRATEEAAAQVQIDTALRELRTGYSTLSGAKAKNVAQDYAGRKDDILRSAIDSVEDPVAKENISQYAARQYEKTAEWVGRYQITQDAQARKEVDIALRDSISKDVGGAPTVGLMDALDQGVAKATANFLKMEEPSKAQAINYSNTVTDDLYETQITQRFIEDPEGAAAFWEKNKGTVESRVSAEVYNRLAAKYEQTVPAANLETAFREVHSMFRRAGGGFDAGGAAEYMADPDNWEKHNLDAKQAMYMSSQFEGQFRFQYQQEQRAIQRKADNVAAGVVERMQNNDFTGASNYLRKQIARGNIGAEQGLRMQNSINQGNMEVVPQNYWQLFRDIDDGVVTTTAQIVERLGRGIGKSPGVFVEHLNRVLKAKENGNQTNFLDEVEGMYLAKARQKTGKHLDPAYSVIFKEAVRQEAQRQKLTVFDNQVLKIADELMGKQIFSTETGEPLAEKPIQIPFMSQGFRTGAVFERQEYGIFNTGQRIAAPTAAAPPPSKTLPENQNLVTNEEKQRLAADPWSAPGETEAAKVDYIMRVGNIPESDRGIVEEAVANARPTE